MHSPGLPQLATSLAACLFPSAVFAAPIAVQGVLKSVAGGVAPDGNYTMVVRVFESQAAQKELWKEVELALPVAGGLFAFALGEADQANPMPADLFTKNASAWLSVQIPPDPEFPRVAVQKVPYAFRADHAATAGEAQKAAVAAGIECAGCVKSVHVEFSYAGSTQKGGAAADLQCSGCVTGDEIAEGAVGNAQLAVNYAASDKKGGPALEAKSAQGLACTGCVGVDHIAAGTVAKLLPPATDKALGGVIAGAHLTVDKAGVLAVGDGEFVAQKGGKLGGNLDFAANEALLFRVQNADKAPADCDAAHMGMIWFDTKLKTFVGCDGSKWFTLASSCAPGGCQENPAVSCKAVAAQNPGAKSGLHWLSPAQGNTFQAYCDMAQAGGGWTLVAVVAQGDAHNWKHSAPTPNNWENSATFGNPDPNGNADFRSAAFHTLAGKELLLTYKGNFLLRTDDACLKDKSLAARLSGLAWESSGSENYANHPPSTHPCNVADWKAVGGELALVWNKTPTRVYLKAGEADGAQDTNKDRVYLSSNIRGEADYPRGLGAFNSGACGPPNCENDVGGFNGDGSGNDVAVPGNNGDVYGIWVR